MDMDSVTIRCSQDEKDSVRITHWDDGEWTISVSRNGKQSCIVISARDMDDIKSLINAW